jgi:dihydroxyacetone kinase-like protein
VALVVATIAATNVENESYFSELDSVVGDGDFGYSLARGFEVVQKAWEELDRSDPGALLKRVALIITSRMGGTSGPLWGTAFLRAAAIAAATETVDGRCAVAMLRAAAEGIQSRGGANLGDKTLLDALVPATDTLERELVAGVRPASALASAARTARMSADGTAQWQARRGRASYAGERSIGSPDAGAVATAVIFEAIAAAWPTWESALEERPEVSQ